MQIESSSVLLEGGQCLNMFNRPDCYSAPATSLLSMRPCTAWCIIDHDYNTEDASSKYITAFMS